MHFGMCMGIDNPQNIKIAKDAGFDYVECGFGFLSQAEDSIFEKFRDELKQNNIKCEAANCFLPADYVVIGQNYHSDKFTSFIEKGMKRGTEIGLEMIVFGSSIARSLPSSVSYIDGFSQLADFLGNVVSPIAKKYGMTVVIEPLRKDECNMINTVKEGALLAMTSGEDNIACLADLYHMEGVGDTVADIRQLRKSIRHAHFSNPESKKGLKRDFPKSLEEYDYKSFIEALEFAGCERCSIEARCTDFSSETVESGKLIALLR